MVEGTLRRAPHVLSEVMDGRAVLVTTERMELVTLNAVGTVVWEELAEPVPQDEIVDRVLERTSGGERGRIEADVASFLAELDELGFVVRG